MNEHEFRLFEHKRDERIRYWVREDKNTELDFMPLMEVRSPRNIAFGSQEIASPEMSARSGLFTTDAVRELYREV